jgi:glutamyl endopeptidase
VRRASAAELAKENLDMNTNQTRHKAARLAALFALLALVLLAVTPLQTIHADEPEGIDVIVTNDGQKYRAQAANGNISRANVGSGVRTFNESGATPRNGKVMQFGNQTETVIAPDGRTQVTNTQKYPNRAIASLVMTFPDGDFICTGWFIGPDTLATAGHCVFDTFSGSFASKILVYPGRNGNNLPYGQAKATQLSTNNCWVTTANPKCDYGLIRINKNKGNQVGWFSFMYQNDKQQLLNRQVSVRGYPGDKPSGTLWTMKGPLQVITKKQIGYSIDTFGGQSGSPIFGNYLCDNCSLGIHAYGFNPSNPEPPFFARNSGTRITEKVYNVLCNWSDTCN